jgi:hypothetical protein
MLIHIGSETDVFFKLPVGEKCMNIAKLYVELEPSVLYLMNNHKDYKHIGGVTAIHRLFDQIRMGYDWIYPDPMKVLNDVREAYETVVKLNEEYKKCLELLNPKPAQELQSLKEKIEKLYETVNDMIGYAPGGSGWEEAKLDYEQVKNHTSETV